MRIFNYLMQRNYNMQVGVVLEKDQESATKYLKNKYPFHTLVYISDITLDIITWIPQLPKVTYD